MLIKLLKKNIGLLLIKFSIEGNLLLNNILLNPTNINLTPYKMIQKKYFKTKDYCKLTFTFNFQEAENVEILGLNGDWVNAIVMKKKKDGTFTCEVNLPKNSEHQFKYKANETIWFNDSDADTEIANEFGGTNSIVVI